MVEEQKPIGWITKEAHLPGIRCARFYPGWALPSDPSATVGVFLHPDPDAEKLRARIRQLEEEKYKLVGGWASVRIEDKRVPVKVRSEIVGMVSAPKGTTLELSGHPAESMNGTFVKVWDLPVWAAHLGESAIELNCPGNPWLTGAFIRQAAAEQMQERLSKAQSKVVKARADLELQTKIAKRNEEDLKAESAKVGQLQTELDRLRDVVHFDLTNNALVNRATLDSILNELYQWRKWKPGQKTPEGKVALQINTDDKVVGYTNPTDNPIVMVRAYRGCSERQGRIVQWLDEHFPDGWSQRRQTIGKSRYVATGHQGDQQSNAGGDTLWDAREDLARSAGWTADYPNPTVNGESYPGVAIVLGRVELHGVESVDYQLRSERGRFECSGRIVASKQALYAIRHAIQQRSSPNIHVIFWAPNGSVNVTLLRKCRFTRCEHTPVGDAEIDFESADILFNGNDGWTRSPVLARTGDTIDTCPLPATVDGWEWEGPTENWEDRARHGEWIVQVSKWTGCLMRWVYFDGKIAEAKPCKTVKGGKRLAVESARRIWLMRNKPEASR